MLIEDYALIGDTQTAALVGKDGSIDWACFPRFDSDACFARLLGSEEHGRFSIAPAGGIRAVRRRYRPGTLVLETEMDAEGGTILLTDCMPIRGRTPDIVRCVRGLRGEVKVRLELILRFDYGHVVPWVRTVGDCLRAVAGPDALQLHGDVRTHGEGLKSVAEFTVKEGETRSFVLTWYPSHEAPPKVLHAPREIELTDRFWRQWSASCRHKGGHREEVVSSLVVLKALTYEPTGGIVAAPTTSLPEVLGGERNWDYRFCWLRDATLTLYALLLGGYRREAEEWRDWLLRAVAGDVSQLQIMYGLAGERMLDERELKWLPGYQGARPVRIGNGASNQVQLDVYGEVMDVLYQARRMGVPADEWSWDVQRKLVEYLEGVWDKPDEGIWEVRGGKRQFTYSKMMAWVAFDRAVRSIEGFGLGGPVEKFRALRDRIHEDVCKKAWNPSKHAFTQSYGSDAMDASVLLMPLLGFLPIEDPRVQGTVAAVERDLIDEGLVRRYRTEDKTDGLQGREGAFLACSFWLADVYNLSGRSDEAQQLFRRLLALRNDVGLLSEEYDTRAKRMLGNFPQAFSHLALVNTAYNLSAHDQGAADHRPER